MYLMTGISRNRRSAQDEPPRLVDRRASRCQLPCSAAYAIMRSQSLPVLGARASDPREIETPRCLLAPPGTAHARHGSHPATPPHQIHASVTVAPPGHCSLRAVRYNRPPPHLAAPCWPTPPPGQAGRGHCRESGPHPGRSGRGPARPAPEAGADPPTALPTPAG